jgi:hypothetical protein
VGADRRHAEFLDQFEATAQSGAGEQGVRQVEPPAEWAGSATGP